MEEMLDSRKVVERAWLENGISNVLVDAREVDALPTTIRLFTFGSTFRESKVPPFARFAIVPSIAVREDIQFLETVMVNRSLKARMFDTIDAALDWLKA